MSAFQDDFTHPFGSAYFVTVEPDFVEQVSRSLSFSAPMRLSGHHHHTNSQTCDRNETPIKHVVLTPLECEG